AFGPPTSTPSAQLIFFFVSSRRRHTRFSRDWSSDVCSSDLAMPQSALPIAVPAALLFLCISLFRKGHRKGKRGLPAFVFTGVARSEERRVGRECRRWWAAGQHKRTRAFQAHVNHQD